MSRKTNKARVGAAINKKDVKRQRVLLIWAALFVIYGIIFYYIPLGGWIKIGRASCRERV